MLAKLEIQEGDGAESTTNKVTKIVLDDVLCKF